MSGADDVSGWGNLLFSDHGWLPVTETTESETQILGGWGGEHTHTTILTVHFKWMKFIVCELCLNKAVISKKESD